MQEVVHLKGVNHHWDTSELTAGYFINCPSPSGVRRILHSKPINVDIQLTRRSQHCCSPHCPKEHGLCQTGDSIGVSSHSLEAFLCMTQTHAHTVSAVILCESGLCGRFTPCNQSGLGYIQHTPRACIQHEHRHVGEYYLSTNMALYIFTSFIHIPYIPPRNGTATHTASIFGCKEQREGA